MRIAYVGLHLERKIIEGGVGRKIFSQIQCWRDAGHSVQFFLLTPDQFESDRITSFRFTSRPSSGKAIARMFLELNRSAQLARLIKQVAKFQPDIIYLRYGLFTFPLLRLFSVAPVVVELNTLDVQEYRYRGPFFYLVNRITRVWMLRRAAGLMAVSHEIAQANQSFGKPVKVIANGIDLENYVIFPAPCNDRPTLVLVGTPGYMWQGVDKLVQFAERFPDLQVEIIGYGTADVRQTLPGNLYLHGFLKGQALKAALEQADVAFGTLALHRKQMEEASPLKIREALAYGIPVVLPYQDTDFLDCSLDFIFPIPNQESNLETHGQAVHDFAYQMRGKRVDREQVAPRIDQRLKEKERLAFFEQIIRTGRGQ